MFEFRLPDVGEGVAEGEVVAWHVEPGDAVEADQVLAEIETDKAVVDLPSPVAGTVTELHAAVGDVVPVGEVLVSIDPAADAEAAEAAPGGEADADVASDPSSSDRPAGRVVAPPRVRRVARELGVAIEAITGSGPGGRITEADVREAAGRQSAERVTAAAVPDTRTDEPAEEPAPSESKPAIRRVEPDDATAGASRERTLAAPATRRLAAELDVDLNAVPTETTRDGEAFVAPEDVEAYASARGEGADRPDERDEDERETRERYRGVRRSIGQQMERAAFTAPHVTHHDTAVVTTLVEARDAMKPRAETRGISLSYLPFVMKAVVAGLREFPVLNSSLDEAAEEIVYKHHYDIGVATATEAGLMVPVVRDVDEKGVLELAAAANERVARARDRSITREEMQGGTFTITNFGAIGGEYATPIINHPETAILGLGAIEDRPVAVDGDVVARPTLPLSLSIDHRVIDGAEAARFANTVIDYLETPSLLLLE